MCFGPQPGEAGISAPCYRWLIHAEMAVGARGGSDFRQPAAESTLPLDSPLARECIAWATLDLLVRAPLVGGVSRGDLAALISGKSGGGRPKRAYSDGKTRSRG